MFVISFGKESGSDLHLNIIEIWIRVLSELIKSDGYDSEYYFWISIEFEFDLDNRVLKRFRFRHYIIHFEFICFTPLSLSIDFKTQNKIIMLL